MVRADRVRCLASRPDSRRPAERRGGDGLRLRRILVLYWYPQDREMRLSVRQHLHVLDGYGARVLYHNAINPVPPLLPWAAPDLCILHTTFLGVRWEDDFEEYRDRFRWVARLRCPKIALPQDEYDHAAVLEDWLLELGATSVYSCFGPEQRSTLYPALEGRLPFRDTLTGFIDRRVADELAARITPHEQRPFDIVYRAIQLPYWFGSHGQLKHRIGEAVRPRATALGFRTDISTRSEDTIYGPAWLDFVLSGRAIIGCESGSSVLDPRGEIRRRIRELLAAEPDLTFEDVAAYMPNGWDSYAFFAISPRHLEAVVTKTAQVLVEGDYSGILEPERHYIPLHRDLGNLDEALERLRDVEAVEAMTERAYRDLYLEGGYTLDDFAEELWAEVGPPAKRVGVPLALARRPLVPSLPESLVGWSPLRTVTARRTMLFLTLLDGLAHDRESRRLLLAALRGKIALPLIDVVGDLILLQALARMQREADGGGEAWSVSAENAAGTVVVTTRERHAQGSTVRLGGTFERVVWDHSAAGRVVPLYPQCPDRAGIALDAEGRHEFRTLAEAARHDAALARAALERALRCPPRP